MKKTIYRIIERKKVDTSNDSLNIETTYVVYKNWPLLSRIMDFVTRNIDNGEYVKGGFKSISEARAYIDFLNKNPETDTTVFIYGVK